MENSVSLRVSSPCNDKIVAINHAFSTYVDQAYFKEYFNAGTKDDQKSFSVRTVGVEIGWVLNDDSSDGYKFLIALNQSANLELFKLDINQIIIEYLYQRFKVAMIRVRLPKYLLYLVTFMLNTLLYENMVGPMIYSPKSTFSH